MSENTARNSNQLKLNVKKTIFWVVIGLVVSISMVLLIVQKYHFESPTIDLSTIISENEIQHPFLATLNNSFGVVSSEEGLPFFELFTSENSDEFYLDQIYIDDGFYFSFSNQSQKNPYSSLWYFSYKEKNLSMLMENNEASYTLVGVTPNHNLLELDCFINENEDITTWYNISSKSFVDIPEEIRDNIDLVYYLKNQNECILCSRNNKESISKISEELSKIDNDVFSLENLEIEPSQFEYYFWNQTEQEFRTIGSGTSGNMTSDGSFFIITDYQKKTTDVFDSETKKITPIPWISDANKWKIWQGSNKVYTTNYLEKSNREIVSPIHIVNLETMFKKVVELPVENVEVGSEKIIYKGRFLKQKEAYQIIQNSSERPTTKTKLISFLVDINSDGATNVKEENSSKYIRMIKKLNCLDINPMLIPSSAKVDSFENPIHKLHGITPQEIRRFPSRI
jgi:hypothetical protein